MKISANYDGEIILEDVYETLNLKTSDNETMEICMRDSGYEFNYMGIWYEAKNGILKKMEG